MKLNISYPYTGQEKLIEINDDQKLMPFMDKHIGQEVEGSSLGDEYKGYLFKISGGNDKQGFPMKQGILTSNRVRVLLTKGQKCYRPRRDGERKRKSVRGCITSNELCVLDLVIVKKGPKELAGLTDKQQPRRLGPKRAGKIRKMFSLTKEDDVKKFVARRTLKNNKTQAPKIQRLVTPLRIARKKYLDRQKVRKAIKTRTQLNQYKALIAAQRKKEKQELLEKARNGKTKDKKNKKAKKEEEKKEEVKKEEKPAKKDTKKTTKVEEKKPAKAAAPAKADKKAAAPAKADKKAAAPAKADKKAPAKADKKAAAPAKADKKAPAKAAPAKTEKKAAAPAKVEKKAPAKAAPAKAKAAPAKAKAAPAKAKAAPAPAKGKKPAKKN